MVGVGVPLLVMVIVIVVINMLQKWKPQCLPGPLRSWDFLPLWAHSLAPWDKVVSVITAKCCCCCKCCQIPAEGNLPRVKSSTEVYDNLAMSAEKEVEIEMNIEQDSLKITRL